VDDGESAGSHRRGRVRLRQLVRAGNLGHVRHPLRGSFRSAGLLMPRDWEGHPLRKDFPSATKNRSLPSTSKILPAVNRVPKKRLQKGRVRCFQPTKFPLDEFRHLVSERAVTGETVLLNMGPQHPPPTGFCACCSSSTARPWSTASPISASCTPVLRRTWNPKRYEQAEVMTDRLDYMNTIGNNLPYCLAIEKLGGLDVPPRPRRSV